MKIRERPGEEGVTLVVCHNGIGQALLGTAFGWDASNFRRHEFANTAVLSPRSLKLACCVFHPI